MPMESIPKSHEHNKKSLWVIQKMPFIQTLVLLLGRVHFFSVLDGVKTLVYSRWMPTQWPQMDFPKAVHSWFSFSFS